MTTYLVFIHEEAPTGFQDQHWLVLETPDWDTGEACCVALEECGIPSISIEMVEAEHVALHPEQYGVER